MKKKTVYFIFGCVFLIVFIILVCIYIKFTSVYVNNSMFILDGKTIVIDVGHGGIDPGKVGKISNEDDVNLAMAIKLKDILSSMGAKVVLTREDEEGLVKNKTDEWSKKTDMRIRREIINSNDADIMISIHMNSHTDPSCKGAQIFYPKADNTSKQLALLIKEQTDNLSNDSKKREIKQRDDLFILKENNMPCCIVECGFMSNPEEEKNLNDEKYQEQVAWYIALGIAKFLLA